MEDDPKQKLDRTPLQSNPLHNNTHLHHNHPLKVNLFLPITDIHFEKLQSPLDQPQIPNIQEEKTKSSRLNQNNSQQTTKGNEKKKKPSQKSDHYHRARNSRRIKTKKVTKDYLQKSQYFYVDDINESGPDGPIMSLLNEYEAFQQSILNACFERRVIKLSHYGNRNKIKKTSTHQVSYDSSLPNNNHQKRSRSFESYPKLTNHLTKSVVQNPAPKLVTLKEVVSYGKQAQSPQLNYVRNPMLHSVELGSNTDEYMNKKLVNENTNFTKHTTPVRTIYLNQGEKKFNLYPNLTNKSSPIQNMSYLTPLGSGRSHIKYKLKSFKNIIQNPTSYEPHQQEQIQNHLQNSAEANSFQSSNYNKICGISVFSAKKDNDLYKPQRNIKVVDILKQSKSRTIDEMVLTQQITLPHNPNTHQFSHHFSDLKKFSVTLTSQNSHSRSRSKRGLSLTQSATKFKSKLESIKKSNQSITSSANKKQGQKNDILDKKLNVASSIITKRVQIRIY